MSSCGRYGAVKDLADNSFVPSEIPEGCTPIHLNLVVWKDNSASIKTKQGLSVLDIAQNQSMQNYVQDQLAGFLLNASLFKILKRVLESGTFWDPDATFIVRQGMEHVFLRRNG